MRRSSIVTPNTLQRSPQKRANEGYSDFTAAELYCPKCKQAMPVRERLLLVIPGGDVFDYTCSQCGTSLGRRNTAG
jgi:hypothetical protein